MRTYINPPETEWRELIKRPQLELDFLDGAVRNILHRVRKSGDDALRELTLQFDKVALTELMINDDEVNAASAMLPDSLKDAMKVAALNIESFHAQQRRESNTVETMPGVQCWRKAVPIERVGIYIPGGTAPLFSTVLMLGIPARLAGCREIILTTPPNSNGSVHPAILFAAQLVGITKIVKVGGAQAIGALAYGTQTIPAVYKIFGPGNQFVTRAKQMVMEDGVAIDIPAGPSEVLVFADESANPTFVAADLLSQAEHGEDSQVMLVASREDIIRAIQKEIDRLLPTLPRKEFAQKALIHSRAVTFDRLDKALRFINAYAPEHLIINRRDATDLADQINNAGSVFLGNYSPEAVGDYASGTNHTLPTNGYARAYAGISLESYLKYITFQRITEEGLRRIGPIVNELASAEALEGHRLAVEVRLRELTT